MNRDRSSVSRWVIPVAGLAIVFATFFVAADAAAEPGILQGFVTDAGTGEAIEGAMVVARGGQTGTRGSGGGGHHGFHAWTDGSGFYAMDGMPAGEYTVYCGAEGYQLATAAVTIEDGQTATLDFALEELVFGSVNGTVIDAATGDPIDGAYVLLHRDYEEDIGGGHPPFFAITAGDGTYLIDRVPAGEYLAHARAWGYVQQEPLAIVVEDGVATTADFALEPLVFGSLEGVVTDAATGAPVEGAMVHAHLAWSGEGNLSGEDHGGWHRTETDADGFYRFENLAAGSYEVRAAAHGYFETDGEAEIMDGQTTVLDLALEPLTFGSVTGTVTNAVSGEGVSGAMVMLFRGSMEPRGVRSAGRPGGWLRAETGDSGEYTIEDVPAGDYAVWVWAAGFEWMEPVTVTVLEGEPTVVDIALQPLAYGALEGVVRDGVTGEPVAGALVYVRRGWFGELASNQEHGGSARAITDADGAFAFDELATGVWDVRVFAHGYRRGSAEAVIEADQTTTVEISLEPR